MRVMLRFAGRSGVVFLLLVSGLLLSATPASSMSLPADQLQVTPCFAPQLLCHQVVQGEWLWKIARLGVPGATPARNATADPVEINRRVQDLIAWNRQVLDGNPSRLRPGQVLVVADNGGLVDLSCDQAFALGSGDDGRSITLPTCAGVVLELVECRSCGYAWKVTETPDQSVVEGPRQRHVPPPSSRNGESVGGAGTAVFDFRTVGPGVTRLRLEYIPPGGQPPADQFAIEFVVR